MFERLFRRTPDAFNLQINEQDQPLRALAKDSILQTALNNGLAFPHNCRVGGCGECKCKLLSGKVKELTDKSYLLSAQELKENYILACQSLPRSDVHIEVALRTAAARHPLVSTKARIESMAALTHDIMHLRLRSEQPMPFSAGQYAELAVAAVDEGRGRSYSFASACLHDAHQPDNALAFFIRKVQGGAFTQWLFDQARPGQVVDLNGPFGDFGLRPGSSPIVCIAGGSGLAPIVSILEQAIAERQAQRDLVLIFGARTQADLYALDVIDSIRRQWSGRFEFQVVLSDEPAGSEWKGRRGFVTTHIPALLGEHLSDHQAYLCGPPAMIDSCIEKLRQGGMDPSHIHFDKFLDRRHLGQAPSPTLSPS